MGNLVDYLKWRGDLPFWENAFNEVDNLVLSYLSYYDFQDIVPGVNSAEGITVKEAAYQFFQTKKERNPFLDYELLEVIAGTKRFGSAILWNYEDIYDTDREKTQFAAMHILLGDGITYISFRGTDNTIMGWREDFSMSYETVSAQNRAAEYLEKTVESRGTSRYRIGGHSKGGNLAAYGAMMCSGVVRERILQVYMNASPGFCPAMLDEERYSQVRKKIIWIAPEFSIIGMLFEREEPEQGR